MLLGLLVDEQRFADEVAGDDFPLELVHGSIDRLTLQIPWTNLMNRPVKIEADGLSVVFRPKGSSSPSQAQPNGSVGAHPSVPARTGDDSRHRQQQRQLHKQQTQRFHREQAVAALEMLFSAGGDSAPANDGASSGKPGRLATRVKQLLQVGPLVSRSSVLPHKNASVRRRRPAVEHFLTCWMCGLLSSWSVPCGRCLCPTCTCEWSFLADLVTAAANR